MSFPRVLRFGSAPILVIGSLSAWGCASALSAQNMSSGCRVADAVRVPARLGYLKELVSSSDSDQVSTRQDLGLTTMSSNKVSLVTKETTCQAAVTALNTVRQEPGTERQVWVYALGTAGYAVDDPGQDQQDVSYSDKVMYFFDRNFVYKRTLSGF
jgi:hypothetical protein